MRRWLARARRPLVILPYDGFGTAHELFLCGRVLARGPLHPGAATDRAWRNLVATYHRFESDEVPRARVRARFREIETEAIADREGYFSLTLRPRAPAGAGRWHEIELELVEPRAGAKATGRVLVPSTRARYGVISDIDDTVVESNVTRKVRMLLSLAVSSAHTRKPFPGVAAFYRALHDGATGREGNPIFYVSKSPWNLYPLLVDFFALQGIPPGPLLLRDFGPQLLFSRARHKASSIERILAACPGLKFILIGDSGEEDPEIYASVVRRSPGRVRAIYIRSVRSDPARLAAIDRLIAQVRRTGCQLVLAPDSEFAAAHAAGEGLIAPAALAEIRREKAAERPVGSGPISRTSPRSPRGRNKRRRSLR